MIKLKMTWDCLHGELLVELLVGEVLGGDLGGELGAAEILAYKSFFRPCQRRMQTSPVLQRINLISVRVVHDGRRASDTILSKRSLYLFIYDLSTS